MKILPLSPADIGLVQTLCDRSVGAGFYTQAHLRAISELENHFFNLLWSEDGQLIGYNYNFLCGLSTACAELKMPEEELSPYAKTPDEPVFGICKSMGIITEERRGGFGFQLLSHGVGQLFEHGAQSLWGTAWKQGTRIPIQGVFDMLGFSYLHDLKNVWYDVEGLQCPVCRQPHCVCDAAVFYKLREGLA